MLQSLQQLSFKKERIRKTDVNCCQLNEVIDSGRMPAHVSEFWGKFLPILIFTFNVFCWGGGLQICAECLGHILFRSVCVLLRSMLKQQPRINCVALVACECHPLDMCHFVPRF